MLWTRPLDFLRLEGAAQNRSPTRRDRKERRGGAGGGEGPGGLGACPPTPGGGGEEAAFPARHRVGPAWPWEPGEGGVLDPRPGRGCPAQGHRLARRLLGWARRREVRGPSRSPLWDEAGGPGQPGWGPEGGASLVPPETDPPTPHMTPGLWQEVAGPGSEWQQAVCLGPFCPPGDPEPTGTLGSAATAAAPTRRDTVIS